MKKGCIFAPVINNNKIVENRSAGAVVQFG